MYKLFFQKYVNKKTYFATVFFSLLMSVDGFIMPQMIKMVTDGLNARNWSLIIWGCAVGLFGQYFISTMFLFWQRNLWKTIESTNVQMKDHVLRNFFNSSYEKLNGDSSSTISFLLNDIRQIGGGVIDTSISFLYSIFLFLSASIYILILNWQIGLIFIGMSLLSLLTPKFFDEKLEENTKRWTESNTETTAQLTDSVKKAPTIVNYSAVIQFANFVKGLTSKTENRYFHYNFDQLFANIAADFIIVFTNILPLLLGAFLVLRNNLDVGTLIGAFMASSRVSYPIKNAIQYWNQLKANRPMVNDLIGRTAGSDHISERSQEQFLDDVELKNATVVLSGKTILSNVNLEIEKGQKVLVVGESGAGKSTLIKTILGQLKLSSGELIVNHKNHQEINLTNQFSYINQDAIIFDLSLHDNVTLFHDFDDTKVRDAIEQSQLDSLVDERGLDYRLGIDGTNISGGQKRRVEVARAILHARGWLVIDEGLSSLDEKTANEIHQQFMNYPGTVIDIEHNLDSELQKEYDTVYLIENGHVSKLVN